ncbi:hypothetical protein FOA43_001315 [Brettanomyces nanus]|uniref:EamA domain-containing protein n=1 Tax=Eeniella nana TaxID=13502 RepID=A0A875RZ49_EENNA|nr:uncharacterized protein FOA43_001315 [Brettanomyces nanus]QPG73998.1 hypothetical protein FOA43_001315 [Brettanomyces nanus]
MFFSTLRLCIVLNIAASTWYIAMQLSTGADVTAIYNSSAFTAYVFAIPLLHEAFSWLKASSVIIAITGVAVVAYGGPSDSQDTSKYPHRLLGDSIILGGAILYGFYEVLYKKECCPPSGDVSARREATFSNFTMCLIGINSCIVLSLLLLVAHLLGFYTVHLPKGTSAWWIVILSILSNMVFTLSFLGLMSLTSPVFSSVASLLTILLVGATEWMFRGISIGWLQLLGYCFIMTGFGLLTYASWSEISEEDTEDQLIDTDTESSYSNVVSVAFALRALTFSAFALRALTFSAFALGALTFSAFALRALTFGAFALRALTFGAFALRALTFGAFALRALTFGAFALRALTFGAFALGALTFSAFALRALTFGAFALRALTFGAFALRALTFGAFALRALTFGAFALRALTFGAFALGALTFSAFALRALTFGAFALGALTFGALAALI